MSPAIRDSLIPGSVRVEVTESIYITVRCGRCGAEHETFAGFRTSRCRNCGRVCHLDSAAGAGPDVIPIRRHA